MSEQIGEKTEQPTPRRLEEAVKKGQTARSAEVQTAFVLLGGLAALTFSGQEIWQTLVSATTMSLGHLHDTPVSRDMLQGYAASAFLVALKCAGPVLVATVLAGLLAGAIQNRFNTAPEALTPDWNRLNPVEGFKKKFSLRQAVPTALAIVKFAVIVALTYTEIRNILADPIFRTSVGVGRIAAFLAQSSLALFLRVGLALLALAAVDYAYQLWRTQRDLMMTKQELKDEMKNSEGNPQVKAARRRRRPARRLSPDLEVPKADVVLTNPTHLAVALRYNPQTMRAPMIVAKGIRLSAQHIRDLAQRHQIPILENKPLARMLYKHGHVGREIPAALYAAVAEILAWVYRVNRYRYYAQQNLA